MAQLFPSSGTPHLLLLLLALLLDDLLSFISFLTSHPLPFLYLFFFVPYLLPFLSFLSPLLLSTSLLLFPHLNDPPPHFLGSACRLIFDTLKSKFEGKATIGLSEQFALMVLDQIDHVFGWEFETMMELYTNSSSECEMKEDPTGFAVEDSEKIKLLESLYAIGDKGAAFEAQLAEVASKPIGEFHEHSCFNCESKEDPVELSLENSNQSELLELDFIVRDQGAAFEAKEVTSKADSFTSENPSRLPDNVVGNLSNSPSLRRKDNLGRALEGLQRDGSTRKEKEWKRTLACKLYEERMTFKLCEERKVVDGAEEMDMLWEAYEVDANKAEKPKNRANNGKKEEKEEQEEEEEDETVGKLCCLQALRFSTTKMNLGVGRPNLVKISKVFKGMGIFHRSGSRRSRKG